MKDTDYGNPDVKGADAMHGSMVSGIIGGIRGNGIGVEGIADNVQFMALRAVPNGDEQDKDIALAIRYAVDNGANIINMSFGKYYSPLKSDVNEAVKYAASKGVLMIKASGNDETNIDEKTQYPNPIANDGSTIPNWITVGANGQLLDKKLSATFSNYGVKNVHIYAPGVGIISTVPDSQYDMANGTSFACPVVTGVAALVWSYYPELTAGELKEILLTTGTSYKKKKVYQPGYTEEEKTKTKFGKLSATGSIVNAYNALVAAEKKTAN
ncbi:MAG: S8 family serine peptidase [Flavobacteriales bacterium]|nr:S8 family serine peptidase [Flavobacteriales bacterium]